VDSAAESTVLYQRPLESVGGKPFDRKFSGVDYVSLFEAFLPEKFRTCCLSMGENC